MLFKDVLNAQNLTKTWRIIRDNTENDLVRDPLDHLAFEATADNHVRQLVFALETERYRPCPPLVVRAAKRDGLTRPLSTLDVADTVVLKTLVDAIQAALHQGFPPYVHFSRSQAGAFDGGGDSETWFQAWMRHSGNVAKLLKSRNCKYVVKTDVASFFYLINHRLLRQLVANRTEADERLLNLLFYVLETMTWRPQYSDNREDGLPQEDYDASRVLAHAFLHTVDEALKREGGAGLYARWVDDIAVGVLTVQKGRKALGRIQRALEDIGLVPNAAKSRIVSCTDFQKSLYPKENEYLDKVHATHQGGYTGRRIRVASFNGRLSGFLACSEKLESWDRVLRRYYTESRRMQSQILEGYAIDHLSAFPAQARHIFDYLMGQPYSQAVLHRLLEYLKSEDNLYEDVEILAYEFLLSWRVRSPDGQTVLAPAVADHFHARNTWPRPLTDHARGLCTLLLYKHGNTAHVDEQAKYYLGSSPQHPSAARYGIAVLAGTDHYQKEALQLATKYEDKCIRRLHDFLEQCSLDPQQYDDLLRKRAACHNRHVPNYTYFPARMLPLVRLVRTNLPYRSRWDRHLQRVVEVLSSTRQNLVDERSVTFISGELARP